MSTSVDVPNVDELTIACEGSSLLRTIIDVSVLLSQNELLTFRRWLQESACDIIPINARGRLPALARAVNALRSEERELLCRSLLSSP
jgi:hypothetical protein